MSREDGALTIVHLPVYAENPYQPLLRKCLTARGLKVIDGGGGGNFLRTALFRWKADLYHFHWLHPYLLRDTRSSSILRASRFLVEVFLLRLSGARVVWTIHNLVNHDRRFVQLERFYSTVFAKLASGFIVHSEWAKREVTSAFAIPERKPIAVIPQGSYAEHYPNETSRAQCRAKLSLLDDDFVFLFLGRIEHYKGIVELVRAFGKLQKNAKLLIAGRVSDAALLDELTGAIADTRKVRFAPGFVDDAELQTYFNSADVFVFPVREMLNSSSIALAASFGLPSIVPALRSTKEIARDPGILCYDPLDPDGLLHAMNLAIERREELPILGRESLLLARGRTWESVARDTEALYRTVLDEPEAGTQPDTNTDEPRQSS